MKTCLGAILVQVACVIAEHFEKTEFAKLNDTVILTCQHNENAQDPRWRHGNFILSSGVRINLNIPWYKRLQVIVNNTSGEYNLKISNVSTNDYGIYWCEMQINKTVSRQKVLLEQKDEREIISNGNINSTPTGEGTIGLSADSNINYVVFAVGFVVILCLSAACNLCVSFCRSRGRRTLKIQTRRTDIHSRIGQCNDDDILRARSSDEMSNVSSRYESIDENRMITLDRKGYQRSRNEILNFDTSMASDKTYLEVVGDDQTSISTEMNTHNFTELCPQNDDIELSSKQKITTHDLNQSYTSNQNNLTMSEICNATVSGGFIEETINDSVNQYVPLNRNEFCYCQSYSTYENLKN